MKCRIDERIRELRKERGINQSELAKLCNVKQSCVSKWERGTTFPDLETLIVLTEVLETTSDYLLGIKDY
ncbi:MAG: helix-turn-helix transcriptional regulator [Clostridia bacterium]|nr:helix-turn-helix transcriptional regulator [Clostridia bacterium]